MNHPMQTLEEAAVWVASVTGVKAQLVAAGWSAPVAEQMVLEVVRGANARAAAGKPAGGRRA